MEEIASIVGFRVAGMSVAVELGAVERVIRAVEVTPVPGLPDIVDGVVDLGGTIVPVVSLRRRFRLPDRPVAPSDQFVLVRLTTTEGDSSICDRVFLSVDTVSGVMSLPAAEVRKAQTVVPGLEDISGIVRTAGGLILIHDVNRCLSLNERRVIGETLAGRGGYELTTTG